MQPRSPKASCRGLIADGRSQGCQRITRDRFSRLISSVKNETGTLAKARPNPDLPRVLLVEDEQPIRDIVVPWLFRDGFDCREAADGRAAMELLAAAEGGNGIWQRLIDDRDALARVAEKALDACHFDANTGGERPGWEEKCSRACYDCLLSYSNQPFHPLIDRHLIREYLLALRTSTTTKKTERSREEHYAWLEERRDQNSNLEREFLKVLYESGRRLPDRAQLRPESGVYAEADFYYERDGLPGICIFCDGPDHDQSNRKESDQRERGKLGDLGYRVLTIRYDSKIDEQLISNRDVFGIGN